MQNQFNTALAPRYGSSKIDLSSEVKMSCKIGPLYPYSVTPVNPGDRMRENTQLVARFAPLIAPMMHRVNLYTYSFYVPYRIIWDNFKYWIAGEQYPDQEGNLITPHFPKFTINSQNWEGFKESSLADYLGVPPPEEAPVQTLDISILPFRAYQCIFNEYFRNQDVEPDLKFTTYATTDTPTTREMQNFQYLQYKNWEKDYFTSAFTQPQSGDPVYIPLDLQGALEFVKGEYQPVYNMSGGEIGLNPILGLYAGNLASGSGKNSTTDVVTMNTSSVVSSAIDVSKTLSLSNIVNAATISDFTYARQLQYFRNLEKLGGTRYPEILRSFFNVVSSDARLQRPQFLGGGKTPLVVSEVVQQSETTDSSALGDYAGLLTGASFNKHGFKSEFFEEHGLIIDILCILPRSSYQQGIERHWTTFDRYEFYWPQFAHLQEQPVYMKELFVNYKNIGHNVDLPDENPVSNDDVFGYQARYMEYRTKYSRVAGSFRSTLAFWHMGRIFPAPPELNKNFCSTRTSSDTFLRPFAVQDGTDYVYLELYNDLKAIRKMPKYVYPKF